MEEYENLLNRAIDQLPPEVFEHKRFKIPKAYSDIQGNRTFIKNCNRPDTKIIREDRIFILKCAACGAKAPLKPL